MAVQVPVYQGNIPNRMDGQQALNTNMSDMFGFIGGSSGGNFVPSLNALSNEVEQFAGEVEIAKNITLSAEQNAISAGNASLYSGSATYNTGDTVICTNGLAYRCLSNGVSGDNPITSVTGNWLLVGADENNRKALANMSVRSWSSQTAAENNNWRDICYSPELKLFCAIAGYSGVNRVMTSPDGETWTAQTTLSGDDWHSICWSPALSLFCAVGAGTTNFIMTSPDGKTWTARTSPSSATLSSVCWSLELNLFCAVSYLHTNNAITSPDGITWTERALSNVAAWQSICWSPALGLFCAVGLVSSTATVATSPDGIAWTNRSYNSNLRSVCWSQKLQLFCAVDSATSNAILTSPDAVTWTPRHDSVNPSGFQKVTWSEQLGIFCAIGGVGKMASSIDGVSWSERVPVGSNSWMGIVWGDHVSRFVAVGNGATNYVMTSF